MNEMVERVARAMVDREWTHPQDAAYWRDKATRAIAAMRNPTHEMKAAAADVLNGLAIDGTDGAYDIGHEIIARVVDAALSTPSDRAG